MEQWKMKMENPWEHEAWKIYNGETWKMKKGKTISSGGGVPIPVKTYMGSMEMSVLICHIVYSV